MGIVIHILEIKEMDFEEITSSSHIISRIFLNQIIQNLFAFYVKFKPMRYWKYPMGLPAGFLKGATMPFLCPASILQSRRCL